MPSPSSGKPVPAVNQAYQIGREKLSRIDDVLDLCRRTGATCDIAGTSGSITVEYLNERYSVSLHDAEINPDSADKVLPIREKLLIIHYLLTAKGTLPSGKLISFQELPEGHVYYPTFLKRSVQPLVSNFGSDPGQLLRMAEKYGVKSAQAGDVSFSIKAFPNVPLTFVLWSHCTTEIFSKSHPYCCACLWIFSIFEDIK